MFVEGLSKNQRNRIHQRLLASRDMVEASVFSSAKEHAVNVLEKPWIRYLKEDLKTFVELVSCDKTKIDLICYGCFTKFSQYVSTILACVHVV